MLSKGDIILVTDPMHEWAGWSGTIKRILTTSNRVIIKLACNKKTLWINKNKLIKITKKQQAIFESLLREKS